ncbi:MAG: carbohydrate ABC transporter permease [Clostridiales bacterium]|jgi:multiple sugar transport system permease protein|nr:carbohydrate ABC transporter permease [Clostridiales bacterium]
MKPAIKLLACVLIAFVMLVPFVWMLSASFKPNAEIFASPMRWLPDPWYFGNYAEIWLKLDFMLYFLNTAKLAVIITVVQLITCSLAAFAFAKLRFPGRDQIFLGYLATMMVPWHAIMIPQFMVIKSLNLYDTHAAIILLWSFSAFGVFILRQNMISIPDSLHEAAKIDGCGAFRTYAWIILPLTKTGLATLTILTFNSVWNDYMGPMIYFDSNSLKTIQLGLATFKRQYSTNHGAIMAGTVCAIIPIVVVYAAAQKYIIEGVAFSGVKG